MLFGSDLLLRFFSLGEVRTSSSPFLGGLGGLVLGVLLLCLVVVGPGFLEGLGFLGLLLPCLVWVCVDGVAVPGFLGGLGFLGLLFLGFLGVLGFVGLLLLVLDLVIPRPPCELAAADPLPALDPLVFVIETVGASGRCLFNLQKKSGTDIAKFFQVANDFGS